jgi:hypothetical protein
MKYVLASLIVAGACLVGSTASAGVVVNAGPVHVAVCHPWVHAHPVYRAAVVRPVYRPVVRSVWAAPVVVPAPAVVAPPVVVEPAPTIVRPGRVFWYRGAVCIP